MTTICTRCGGTGYLNIEQAEGVDGHDVAAVEKWIDEQTEPHDVEICDCCGDGISWHGEPGWHYSQLDPQGPHGPYAYNGGLCECH
ncbi:MAG: hypothetical protein ACYCOR_20965 [Acidobacteriaceae bacterium]